MWERFKGGFFRELDLVVLITCLIITYGVWQYAIKTDNTQAQSFNEKQLKLEQGIAGFSQNIFIFITGIRGLYEGSENVTDDELATYVKSIDANNWLKSVVRVRFVKIVKTSEAEKYLLENKTSNLNKSPEINSASPEQYFVTQVVGIDGQKYEPYGLNLATDPKRLLMSRLSEQNRSSGMSVLSKLLDIKDYEGSGVIFVVPVVKNNEVVGLINAIVKIDGIMNNFKEILGEDFSLISWNSGSEILVDEREASAKMAQHSFSATVSNDMTWNFIIGTKKQINNKLSLILAGGIAISFLLYVMVYGLTSAGVRGEEIAKQLTSKLYTYKLALDSASNHIVITDVDGVVLYANKAAEKLTGYSGEEIIGKTPRLWGGQMTKDFYVNFWKQIKTDRKMFHGDLNNKRKSGEIYIAEASVSPIIDEKNDLIGFVGVEEDVTMERKLVKENNESLKKVSEFNKLMVGRELKMVELKKEIAELKNKYEK